MKYLIKKTYRATDNNPNFKGQTRVFYCGTRGAAQVDPSEGKEFLLDWYIKGRAYTSKAGLSKALKSANDLKEWEEKAGYWTIDLEVIEVEE